MIRIGSEATDLSSALDVSEPSTEPPGLPATDPPIDPEPRAILEGPDGADGPAAVPAGWAIDAAVDELAPGAGPARAPARGRGCSHRGRAGSARSGPAVARFTQ